jgi:hypothetical protein
MKMKEKYISPEMELIEFEVSDIIVLSDTEGAYDPEGWV